MDSRLDKAWHGNQGFDANICITMTMESDASNQDQIKGMAKRGAQLAHH